MKHLIFYRQCRRDKAIRMGIALDNETTLLGVVVEGDESLENDPFAHVLEWYIDIRCFGSRLPVEAEPRVPGFYYDTRSRFEPGCDDSLRKLRRVGIPFGRRARDRFEDVPRGVRVELVCSATGRKAASRNARAFDRVVRTS